MVALKSKMALRGLRGGWGGGGGAWVTKSVQMVALESKMGGGGGVLGYQICSNGCPGVQNGPAGGGGGGGGEGLGFQVELNLKTFFSRTTWLRCLKFGM